MLKIINNLNTSLKENDKFKCPYCASKGRSVRGFKPKFKTLYQKLGNVIQVFRTSLMQCKNCLTHYAVSEIYNDESWNFAVYQDFCTYQAMDEDYTAPVYLGSTASEWTKCQANGIQHY
jgi:DNA-directed RNA polymerase subunit RPC12/RpoP